MTNPGPHDVAQAPAIPALGLSPAAPSNFVTGTPHLALAFVKSTLRALGSQTPVFNSISGLLIPFGVDKSHCNPSAGYNALRQPTTSATALVSESCFPSGLQSFPLGHSFHLVTSPSVSTTTISAVSIDCELQLPVPYRMRPRHSWPPTPQLCGFSKRQSATRSLGRTATPASPLRFNLHIHPPFLPLEPLSR